MRINLRSRKRKIIAITIVLLIAVGIAFALGVFDKKESAKDNPKQVYYSQLTGTEVDEETSRLPILGVMIENSEEARPQTGLGSAGIVFEAVTEGGITRYLTLFQEDVPEILGPVRSLRTHFLDFVMGFDASIAHVGGSEEALQLADQRKAKSLSQFQYDKPYYRDNSRAAPHNMYARGKDLVSLQDELNHQTSKFEGFVRKADSPATTAETPKVTIDFSSPLFLAEFQYDQATNAYTRYLAGTPHIDKATNKPITVKNVIVLTTPGQPTNGVNAIGSGEALVFLDGKVQKARWQKSSYSAPLKLTSADGSVVALNRGNSWFAAISEGRPVQY